MHNGDKQSGENPFPCIVCGVNPSTMEKETPWAGMVCEGCGAGRILDLGGRMAAAWNGNGSKNALGMLCPPMTVPSDLIAFVIAASSVAVSMTGTTEDAPTEEVVRFLDFMDEMGRTLAEQLWEGALSAARYRAEELSMEFAAGADGADVSGVLKAMMK